MHEQQGVICNMRPQQTSAVSTASHIWASNRQQTSEGIQWGWQRDASEPLRRIFKNYHSSFPLVQTLGSILACSDIYSYSLNDSFSCSLFLVWSFWETKNSCFWQCWKLSCVALTLLAYGFKQAQTILRRDLVSCDTPSELTVVNNQCITVSCAQKAALTLTGCITVPQAPLR